MPKLAQAEEEANKLTGHNGRWAKENVRKERLRQMESQVFKPSMHQLLSDWLEEGRRYSAGEHLPRNMRELHSESRTMWHTDATLSTIRHIIFSFNISVGRFGALMSCFAVLLLGRPLQLDEFLDKRSFNRRLMRLSIFDWCRTSQLFESFITTHTLHGFKKCWFSITDDSKQ